jgi:UDP-N-acetylglucosamine 1-carboxyvinyltransferase
MDSLIIEGGARLSGEITLSGNKNAALPMIAASLLTDEQITLHNVPDIIDVNVMLAIVEELGVSVSFHDGTLTLQAADIVNPDIPHELCKKIRTSILFAAPLLHRCNRASIWPPGGDVIGRRRLDGHFYGLTTMGAQIDYDELPYRFNVTGRLSGRDLFLDEASVTATEQIMMSAVLAEGQTILRNAAAEPHICLLGEMLMSMGANISGLGTNTMTIEGVHRLHGTEFTVEGDHIEAGSFLAMTAVTGGEITIHGTTPGHYWMIRRIFERLGIHLELKSDSIFLPGDQELVVKTDFGNAVPTISDGPWPQFPSDLMSCTIVMATQSKGTVLFFEKMFESRIYFVDRLISMGANAIVCDPHRVVISGPARLRSIEMSSPDIRAGMAMIIAALCATGTSTVNNASVISRGYENIVAKIASLGGKI